jgi:hypothetical protein
MESSMGLIYPIPSNPTERGTPVPPTPVQDTTPAQDSQSTPVQDTHPPPAICHFSHPHCTLSYTALWHFVEFHIPMLFLLTGFPISHQVFVASKTHSPCVCFDFLQVSLCNMQDVTVLHVEDSPHDTGQHRPAQNGFGLDCYRA